MAPIGTERRAGGLPARATAAGTRAADARAGLLVGALPLLAAAVMAASAARAADDPALLRLGVVAVGAVHASGLPAADRLEPFRRRLAAALDRPVTVTAFGDAAGLVAALAAKRLDYAVLSASAYVEADRTCDCLEPLVVPRAADGASAWRAVVAARGDGPVADLAGLKGATVAAAPPAAFAGRRFALAALARAGVDAAAFGRLDTVAGPAEALAAVIDRRADAALAWEPVAAAPREAAPAVPAAAPAAGRGPFGMVAGRPGAETLKVVWSSPPVPHGPHAVRADLPVAWRVRLRDLLTHLATDDPAAYDAIEPDFGGGFVAVDKAAFAALADILAAPAAAAP